MANPPSTPAQNAFKRIARLNGEADWHASTSYDDAELKQIVSLRPAYTSTDNPNEGNLVLHAVALDSAGSFSMIEIEVPVLDLRRLLKQVDTLLDADEEHYFDRVEDDDDDDDETDEEEGEDEDDEPSEEEGEEGDDDDKDDKGKSEKKK